MAKLAKATHHPLKRWRFEHGLTIKETAAMLDCTQGYLSEIENRKKEPTLTFAAAIVKLTRGAVQYSDLVLEQ